MRNAIKEGNLDTVKQLIEEQQFPIDEVILKKKGFGIL